ncbi:MAG: hypothetical protein M3137_15435 [Actinomycetota bacterium]|nr:hypothetical protein [Actinomycetota bacterium]
MTTRSRLKGARFFVPMLRASRRIRRQLAESEEVVRWASVVTGPTEFWTVTVWQTRHDMQEFMRSGAHEAIMWQFSRWLTSFWLMRWRPGPWELGTWRGRSIAQPERDDEGRESAGPRPPNEALDRALEHLPWLKAATGPDGAACYESTGNARRRRAEVGGAGGAMICVSGRPWRTLAMRRALTRIRHQAAGDADFLRAALGFGPPGEVYLMALWKTRDGARRLLSSPELAAVAGRWSGWANEWLPENEFGHWDGLRLRRAKGRHAIPVPEAAMRSARTDHDEAPTDHEPR